MLHRRLQQPFAATHLHAHEHDGATATSFGDACAATLWRSTMSIDLTSPPLPPSLPLSSGIDWISECVGEVQAKAEIDFALMSLLDSEVVKLDSEVARLDGETVANAPLIRALVSALVERMEDRSTIALISEGLAQPRGRAREAAT